MRIKLASMSGPIFRCGLLLTIGVLQVSSAQEPNSKPEISSPEPAQHSIPPPRNPSPFATSRNHAPEAGTVADLPSLANSIATYILDSNCQPKSCTVVVANFTLPDGNTSVYGMQLAETLSRELTRKEYKLRVIDSGVLQTLLAKERLSIEPEEHEVIRWIGSELGARFVVVGTTEKFDNGLVNLSSQLIDTDHKDSQSNQVAIELGPLKSGDSLEPVETLTPLPPIATSSSGEKLQQSGVSGTTRPSCTYMPNPPYSEAARKLKLNGSLTVEAVVNSQGKLENSRIVRGLPGGLNEITLATMRTWRCQPALYDGQPVAVVVTFTVTFRLYAWLSTPN